MMDFHTYLIGGKVFQVDNEAYKVMTSFFDGIKDVPFRQKMFAEHAVAQDLQEQIGSENGAVSVGNLKNTFEEEHFRNILLEQYNLDVNSDLVVDAVKIVPIIIDAAKQALGASAKDEEKEAAAETAAEAAAEAQNEGKQQGKAQDNSSKNNKSQAGSAQASILKKLYRDPNDMWCFGLLSGLAHYFDMDVAMLRVLFIILLLFTSFIPLVLYFVAALIIPVADTKEKQQQMFGSSAKYELYSRMHANSVNKQRGCNRLGCGLGMGCLLLVVLPFVAVMAYMIFGDFNYCEGHHGVAEPDMMITENTMPKGLISKIHVKGNFQIVINPHDTLFFDSETETFTNDKYVAEIESDNSAYLDSIVFALKDDGTLIIGQPSGLACYPQISFTLPCDLAQCDSIIVFENASVKLASDIAKRSNVMLMTADNASVDVNQTIETLEIIAAGNSRIKIGDNVKEAVISVSDNAMVDKPDALIVKELKTSGNAEIVQSGNTQKDASATEESQQQNPEVVDDQEEYFDKSWKILKNILK